MRPDQMQCWCIFIAMSFIVSLGKTSRKCFFIGNRKRRGPCPFNFLFSLLLVCPLSLSKVKVWFQNRRMKWKRVKGGQQGAAAREKELVNVKKGTLLPSELSGIGAATLQQTGDSLANDDSHDSDHSSEHAHLWYTHRGPAPFSGKKLLCRQAFLRHRLHREMAMTVIFSYLLHAGISSPFLMISRGFNTKCHLLKMLPRWTWRRWTRVEYSRCVGGVCGGEQIMFAFFFLLALKMELLSRANSETFACNMPPEWRCRGWTCFAHSRCMRWWVGPWAGIGFCLHWQLNCFQE